MRWLLRLLLFRLLGSRVVLALAVLAWFRSALQRGRKVRGGRPSATTVDAAGTWSRSGRIVDAPSTSRTGRPR